MLSMGWMFVIFTTLLLCGGLAYTILEFRREEFGASDRAAGSVILPREKLWRRLRN